MTATSLVVVEALSVEGLATELALASRVELPLVVDKTGLGQGVNPQLT